MNTTILYYSDNSLDKDIETLCVNTLKKMKNPIVSVTQEPMDLGTNICVGKIGRSWLNLYKQLYQAVVATNTKYVATAENDCLYTQEHYDWIPPRDDTFYYNENVWFVQWGGNHPELNGMYSSWWSKERKALSQLICDRELLKKDLELKLSILDEDSDFKNFKQVGEPGAMQLKKVRQRAKSGRSMYLKVGLEDYLEAQRCATFKTKLPNVDIKHGSNFTGPKRGKKRRYNLEPWGDFTKLIKSGVL